MRISLKVTVLRTPEVAYLYKNFNAKLINFGKTRK